MPISKITTAREPATGIGQLPAPQAPGIDPTTGAVFGAAFTRENTIVSMIKRGPRVGDPFQIDNDFDPQDGIEGFEDHRDAFAFANTQEDQQAIKDQITMERRNDMILDRGGALGFAAGFVAGMADPIIFFPPARAIASGAKGVSILRGGYETGRAGMAGAGAAEALLHGSQETRTGLESAVNITGAAFLSAILGGSISALVSKAGRKPANSVAEDMGAQVERDLDPLPDVPDIRDEGSLVIPDEDLRTDIPNFEERNRVDQADDIEIEAEREAAGGAGEGAPAPREAEGTIEAIEEIVADVAARVEGVEDVAPTVETGPALMRFQQPLIRRVSDTDKPLTPKAIAKEFGITEKEATAELNALASRNPALTKTAKGFRRSPRRGPLDVLQFLAANGGIRDTAGELAARDAQRFLPGHGSLVRPTGRSFDEAGEILHEGGFFGPPAITERPDVNQVLELIDQGLAGRRVFSEFDLEEVAAKAAQEQEAEFRTEIADTAVEVEAALKEFDIPGISRADVEEMALRVLRDDMDIEDAIEDVIIRQAMTEDAGGPARAIDDTDEIPFGEVEVARARGAVEIGDADRARGPAGPAGRQAGTETTDQGEQFTLGAGTDRISDRELAERAGAEPLRAVGPQQAADEGLFDLGARDQIDLEDILATELDLPPAREAGGSGGAATALLTKTEETVKSAFGIERLTAFAAPGLRMLTSPFLASRRAIQGLARSALVHNKNALGIKTDVAVETLVDAHQYKLGTTIQELDQLYGQYRTGVAKGGRARRLKVQASDVLAGGREEGTLSFKEFKEAVSDAMRNDDQHAIPEVAKAAQTARRDVIDLLKDKAIEAKLLDKDVAVETAASYLTRMYNNEKIIARADDFRRIVTQWLVHRRDTVDIPALRKAEAEIEERGAHILERDVVETDLIGKRGEIKKFVRDRASMEDQELAAVAEEIMGRIISTPAGRLPYDAHLGRPSGPSFKPGGPDPRGPLAKRVFLIPDALIEEFLENDIDVILRAYTRTMAPDVEVALRFGDTDMTRQIKQIQDEAFQQIRLVANEEGLTQRQRETKRTRINKRKDSDIRDLQGMLNRLKGLDGRPDNPNGIGVRTLRVIREILLLSKLGGMTISALPDVFRPVMVEGLTRTLRHAVVPMITNLKGLRMAKAEARELGAIVEMVLDTRVASLADLGDDFGRNTVGERVLGAAADSFGIVSAMAPWNQFWKEMSGTITMSRVLTEAGNWRAGTIKAKDIERLAAGGIDKPMAVRIANEFDRHGLEDRGVMQAGTENWTDRGAAEAMQGAIIREVNTTIVTPGIGDRPFLMTSTQAGKNLGQFKSFMFASHQAVLLAGLQRRDLATLNGLALSVAGGMLVYYLKQMGSERPVSDDPAVWVAEGIDRSGVSGFFFDINNMAEKIGINVLPGGPTRSRYASRNIVGALLGPTAGLSKDVAQIVGNAVSGDIRASDTRALRRVLPYQNLFYMRNLLNRAEEGVNEAFGIPETKRRKTKRRLNR